MWSFDPTAGASPAERPPAAAETISRPIWRRRWLVIRGVLGFCALVILYALVFGADDRLRETATLGAFGLAGAVALGYLGFAVQDDRNWMKALSDAAAATGERR
ncbi:MAG: hypothetical protein MRY74_05840 [Neomegalonema sp.]|nr:hypothetical protein [Neomegalonema sp.]